MTQPVVKSFLETNNLMHTILYKMSNGGVASYPPNPEVMKVMMGEGQKWTTEHIAEEVRRFMLPTPQADWLGYPEAIAREWCMALSEGGLTEDAVLDLFARRFQARQGYSEYVVLEFADLPHHIRGNGDPNHGSCDDPNCEDRYFRDAVRWDDTLDCKCCCDMPIARGIHMDRIRVVRNKELATKDITFMRAVEAGDTDAQATIGTEKQTLRDIPQTFDLTTDNDTPEELRAKWPTELPERE